MRFATGLLSAAIGLGVLPGAAFSAEIDWSKAAGKEVVLFYPGQSSWEWALTEANMSGAKDFRSGKDDCSSCHIGEEDTMGPQIVTGEPRTFKTAVKPPIEPTPIAGKPGTITATVKVANDGTNLYVHLDFAEGKQPNSNQDQSFATKVTVMFNNAKVPEANRGGCFAACHEDLTGMPSGLHAIRMMYLPKSRAKLTRQGGGDTLAAPDALAKLHADGYQLEYWQAGLNPGQPATANAQIVFDKRDTIADAPISAEATQQDGRWSVTLRRPLAAAPPFTAITPDGHYFLAFAIHAGQTAHRFHYVSFERTLAIDSGKADLVAKRQ